MNVLRRMTAAFDSHYSFIVNAATLAVLVGIFAQDRLGRTSAEILTIVGVGFIALACASQLHQDVVLHREER